MTDEEVHVKERGRLAVFETIQCGENGSTEDTNRGIKRPYSPDFIAIDLPGDEYEDDGDYPQSSKSKTKGIRFVEEPLNLKCKWDDCPHVFTNFALYVKHMDFHLASSNEYTVCNWDSCTYVGESLNFLKQHLSYHCYHDRLTNIGENILRRNNLPDCNVFNEFEIPESPHGYDCEWLECNTSFWNITDFYDHTLIHSHNNPKVCKKGEFVHCYWKGCTLKFATQYKLKDHIRTHTKEKIVACPSCGQMYSTKTKFCDHRKRQLPIDRQSYQCSQCSKLFPTERLLRDHMRSHINHYKCTLCDMTCPKPSALATHIRHRHLDERPYKCNLCDYSSVSKHGLEQHLITHCPDKLYTCEECEFSCRSMYGLDSHYQQAHGQATQIYECHCCYQKFKRGNYLTTHLINRHKFHWPSGHSRFKYKEDTDGIFRLQTVRYESIEVTQEMMESSEESKISLKKKEFEEDSKSNATGVDEEIDNKTDDSDDN